MSEKVEIIKNMMPLLSEARRTGSLLVSKYQQIEFTPDRLEQCWAEGRFVWGPVNWYLKKPEKKSAVAGFLRKIADKLEGKS